MSTVLKEQAGGSTGAGPCHPGAGLSAVMRRVLSVHAFGERVFQTWEKAVTMTTVLQAAEAAEAAVAVLLPQCRQQAGAMHRDLTRLEDTALSRGCKNKGLIALN